MRATDVIQAGYNELTYINFVMTPAMPDAVIDIFNGITG